MTRGGRRGHCFDVQVRQIADVHDPESDLGQRLGLTVQQALDDFDRAEIVLRQDRAEDCTGQDGGEFSVAAFALHEVPGGAFGEDLGSSVGVELRVVRIRPHRFVARAIGL